MLTFGLTRGINKRTSCLTEAYMLPGREANWILFTLSSTSLSCHHRSLPSHLQSADSDRERKGERERGGRMFQKYSMTEGSFSSKR